MDAHRHSAEVWNLTKGTGPLVAAAIHDGHLLREELHALVALSDEERLREEDPYTDAWTDIAQHRLVGTRSRFEVDLNRPREKAVYLVPEDAWGLTVWKTPPPTDLIHRSLAEYDAFYAAARQLLDGLKSRYGRFVVLDLHTYNHRRDGPNAPAADLTANPEVNLGTGTMDRPFWGPLVERFMHDLRAFDYLGRKLDVRENVKFKGGGFGKWVHETYPRVGCALSIEFKKFFMDEWTGELHAERHAAITNALRAAVPGIIEELQAFGEKRCDD